MIEINVNGSVVSVQKSEALYSGAQDVYTCQFTLDRSWEKYRKSAVFRTGRKAITAVVNEDNTCVLPWELLVRDNIGLEIEVGMYGVGADGEILTSVWDSIGTVRKGSEIGSDAREPSAGVYEQVMASVQKVDDKIISYSEEVQTLAQRAESAAAVAAEGSVSAAESRQAALGAATAAVNARVAVESALNNLPAGSTLVINDLTTGGTTAALSAEMGKVLNHRPNPNLLHNWCFVNPVNQRGQTSYASSGYSIDRWSINHLTATVDLLENGLVFADTVSGYIALSQKTENFDRYAGREITISVLVTDVSGTVRFAARYGETSANQLAVNFTEPGLYSVTGVIGNNPSQLRAYFSAITANASATITAVKMELGDTQTLAHLDGSTWVLNEIPDYGEELAKCQRYQMVYSPVQYAQLWPAVPVSSNNARVTIQTPVELRTTPTHTFDFSILELFDGVTRYPITTTPTVFTRTGNCIVLNIATNGLNVDKTYMVRATAGTKIVLDANL